LPPGVTSPLNGTPPSIKNFSMSSPGNIAEIVRQIVRFGKHITVGLHGVTVKQ
jgi:hypothetical protein